MTHILRAAMMTALLGKCYPHNLSLAWTDGSPKEPNLGYTEGVVGQSSWTLQCSLLLWPHSGNSGLQFSQCHDVVVRAWSAFQDIREDHSLLIPKDSAHHWWRHLELSFWRVICVSPLYGLFWFRLVVATHLITGDDAVQEIVTLQLCIGSASPAIHSVS